MKEERKVVDPHRLPKLNNIAPVPVNLQQNAIKGNDTEKVNFANISVDEMLNKTPPDGHETRYLKDAAYDGDAEKSHRTNSF